MKVIFIWNKKEGLNYIHTPRIDLELEKLKFLG